MKLITRLFAAFLFFLILDSFFLILPAHASENFTTNYSVLYTITETGLTHTKMNISLTNRASNFYASNYKISVGFPSISNVRASDPDGSITPTTIKTDEGYTIEIIFNKHVVGEGNKLNFVISFDTQDVAQKHGSIWEVNIPGIANPEDFATFSVTVKAPMSFGEAAYIKPNQVTTKALVFTKEQLGTSGISIAFGDKQTYQTQLTYHLQNKNVFPIRTEIALPPNTNYQDSFIMSLEPRPQNVIEDADGNWLAQYRLLPAQKLDVIAKVKIQVYLDPRPVIISERQLQEYVKDKPFWQSQDPKIKKLGTTLKTPEAIYQYVVSALSYDFLRVEQNRIRIGATGILAKPDSAVCAEFTDLFVAIARAAGIPAREVNGFGFSEDPKQRPQSLRTDILHAWPEYYDWEKKTWIMIDPTWANTTGGVDYFNVLDFDHITFVKHGLDSTYPVSAGEYKLLEDQQKKDVVVGFASAVTQPVQRIEMTTQNAPVFLSGFPINGEVVIKNVGETAIMPQTAQIIADSLLPSPQRVTIPAIPPFGYTTATFGFTSTSFLTNATYRFTIQFAGKQIVKEIKVTPFIFNNVTIIGGLILGLLIIIIFIIANKSRRVPVPEREQQGSLRR